MEIDETKCVGCGNCVPYCTMGVIRIENGIATVNEDECVECNTCYRCCESEKLNTGMVRFIRKILRRIRLRYDAKMDVCPTGALVPPELEWPRTLRRAFSDPIETHESTGGGGRGTEEIKTNDVTGRIGPDQTGLVIDMGRPGTGVFFSDIEKMTMALSSLDVHFEEKNPLTALMTDTSRGTLKPEVLGEKVLSAIIELQMQRTELQTVLATVDRVAKELNTVLSVGVSSRCEPDGRIPHEPVCLGSGFQPSLNGKTNLGLGRRYDEAA